MLAQEPSPISYDYFHAGYMEADADVLGIGIEADGLELEGSIQAGEHLFVFGGFGSLAIDDVDDADVSLRFLGVVAHHALGEKASFYAGVGYVEGDVEVGNIGDEDDGVYMRAGVRYMPADKLEVRAGLERIDFDYLGDDLALTLGGTAYLTDVVTVDLGYRSYDDVEFLSLGARFFFGKEQPRF